MAGQKPAQALPGTYSEFQSSRTPRLRCDPHENLRRGDRARHRLADQVLDGLALVGRAEDANSVRGRTGKLGEANGLGAVPVTRCSVTESALDSRLS
jgi:hypothetical protein